VAFVQTGRDGFRGPRGAAAGFAISADLAAGEFIVSARRIFSRSFDVWVVG
jgi:hypothetical protein